MPELDCDAETLLVIWRIRSRSSCENCASMPSNFCTLSLCHRLPLLGPAPLISDAVAGRRLEDDDGPADDTAVAGRLEASTPFFFIDRKLLRAGTSGTFAIGFLLSMSNDTASSDGRRCGVE